MERRGSGVRVCACVSRSNQSGPGDGVVGDTERGGDGVVGGQARKSMDSHRKRSDRRNNWTQVNDKDCSHRSQGTGNKKATTTTTTPA